MRIHLEYGNKKLTLETDDIECFGDELQELFSRMLVVLGFSPSIIKLADDDGTYAYIGKNEKVVEAEDGD